MVAVGADDYAWFTEQCAELADASCLTLVHARTPAEVLEHLGGTGTTLTVGLRRLPGLTSPAPQPGRVVAATDLGDWTLVVEPGGARDSADQGLRELSRGTVLVSHCDSASSDPRFVWMRDGRVLLDFDPTSAGSRRGSEAGRLAEVLDALGFDLSVDDSDAVEVGWSADARYRERALALAEQLTGVRLDLQALETATWRWVTLPDPADAAPVAARPAVIPAPRPAPSRRWSRAEKWDEEYEIDDDDDREDDEDGDPEDREWPRLIRRLGRLFR